MDIETKVILITIVLVALCVPWLYRGVMFIRRSHWQRNLNRSGTRPSTYYCDRYGEVHVRHHSDSHT